MQNLYGGDSTENERKMLQNKSDAITHSKNLDDSFNDTDANYKWKAQVQVDKDLKYRHDLKEQCQQDNYSRAQVHYQEAHDETSRRQQVESYMSEQYQQDRQDKHDESLKLHDERESFKKDCVDFKELQRAIINLEEERIERQSNEFSDRRIVVETERERKLKEKDELNDRMCTRMEADETDRQDREDVITVRHEGEDREKLRQEDEKAHDKFVEDKRELRDGLLLQMEENKQSVRDEQQRELNFSHQASAVMEIEDEREKERARKKKEADDQYYTDLRQQIADNAIRRQKQKEEDAL